MQKGMSSVERGRQGWVRAWEGTATDRWQHSLVELASGVRVRLKLHQHSPQYEDGQYNHHDAASQGCDDRLQEQEWERGRQVGVHACECSARHGHR